MRENEVMAGTIWSWTRMSCTVDEAKILKDVQTGAITQGVAARAREISIEVAGHHEGITRTEGAGARAHDRMIMAMIGDDTETLDLILPRRWRLDTLGNA